ncbi:hypothetical protein JRG18_04880 [Kocuria palustris]|nr:hypothetical protein [Kocuria palustris]MBN6757814.1 hypothetical protein [Kocuria palustris]MBN6762842.1 hypothetical protein [Kocuria palustris]MBN6782324.1 hypothetical protein [Kocuria palustris]MBN6798567.1 hypothetical protein [Kocuria palustris]
MRDIIGRLAGVGFLGCGSTSKLGLGVHIRQHARAFVIEDPADGSHVALAAGHGQPGSRPHPCHSGRRRSRRAAEHHHAGLPAPGLRGAGRAHRGRDPGRRRRPGGGQTASEPLGAGRCGGSTGTWRPSA